jgi:solute carrier family 25 phosphate transporter 23/24/25/41
MVSFWSSRKQSDDTEGVTINSSSAEIVAAIEGKQAIAKQVAAKISADGPAMTATAASTKVNAESQGQTSSDHYIETPEEREARLYALFKRLDVRGEGRLSARDIERGVQEMTGLTYNGFLSSEIVRLTDRSRDGAVSFGEFCAYMDHKERELRQLFDKIDVSRDRRLQAEEFHQSLKLAGINATRDDVKRFMRHLDADGDGSISFDEWRNFLIFLPREVNIINVYRHLHSVTQLNSDGEVVIAAETTVKDTLKPMLAGAMAGAVSRTATAPLDRLKVYLQTHPPQPGERNPLMTGIRQLYKTGGVRTFFRGNGLNVLKIAPESGIKFLTYDRCKRAFGAGGRNPDGTPVEVSMVNKLLAGGTAGVIAQGVIYPLETLKTRMMSSSGMTAEAQGSGNVMLRVAREMWAEAGLRAYFRGVVPSLVGVFPFAAIDLACFETLKTSYIKYQQAKLPVGEAFSPSTLATLVCGMISGTTGAVAVYPLSLVRTRLQAQGTPGHPTVYTGALDVVRKTFAREGIRGFYKGLVPTLVKVVPAVGISYTVYEKSKAWLN